MGSESYSCDAPIDSLFAGDYLTKTSRSTIIHVHVKLSTVHSTRHVSVQNKYTSTNW